MRHRLQYARAQALKLSLVRILVPRGPMAKCHPRPAPLSGLLLAPWFNLLALRQGGKYRL